MSGAYLALLLISLAGLGLLDWHRRLALAHPGGPARGLLTVGIAVVVLLLWDLAGVAAGVFFRGDGPYLIGWQVAPEVPVEEVVFLTLLAYVTLLTWRLIAGRGGDPRPWRRPGGTAGT